MIHVALVSAFPAEADARAAQGSPMAAAAPYLGRWHLPTPERPEVHVFAEGDETAEDLERQGWVRA